MKVDSETYIKLMQRSHETHILQRRNGGSTISVAAGASVFPGIESKADVIGELDSLVVPMILGGSLVIIIALCLLPDKLRLFDRFGFLSILIRQAAASPA